MQHSDDRLAMDLLNISKMIWSTTTSPILFPAFGNLFKLSMHDTGNDVEKYPTKPALPEPPETSPNRSQTHPSQTTSLAKVLPSSNRTTTTTLALPSARAQLPNRRSPPLPTFL